MNENQSLNSHGSVSDGQNVNTNQQASTTSCCEFFVDALNNRFPTKSHLVVNINCNDHHSETSLNKEIVINDKICIQDVEAFLSYCQIWQEK
jgi:hypothetical protein